MARQHWTVGLLLVLIAAGERARSALPTPDDSDEFASPTFTPTVQILSPRAGQLAVIGAEGLLIAYASPEGSWVRLFVDGHEVAFSNSSHREGRIAGIAPGLHRVEAHLVRVTGDSRESLVAQDRLQVHVCLCASDSSKAPPTALVSGILPALENPYQPAKRYMHHEVLFQFGRWEGAFEKGYLHDWLGVRTRYAWDCIKHGGYYKFVPSRRLECERYDMLRADSSASSHIQGFLPPVDDEYPEYIDMLSSVARSKGQHYVVAELGSSYGTWGVRAIAALRRLYPQATYHMIAVESGLHRYRQLLRHVQANNVINHTLVHGFVTSAAERDAQGLVGSAGVPYLPHSHSTYAVGEPRAITLSELLRDHAHIDYLDFDIQGAEIQVFAEPEALDTMNTKVRSVHVGTHSPDIHHRVRALMLHAGWVLELDLEHNARMVECDTTVQPSSHVPGSEDLRHEAAAGAAAGAAAEGVRGEHQLEYQVDWLQRDSSCLTQTDYGPMYIRDGLLSFYNPSFGEFYE